MTLQIEVVTHFQASPLISMRTESLESSQSGHSVDADACCKWALMVVIICRIKDQELYQENADIARAKQAYMQQGVEAIRFLMLKYTFSHILETHFLSFLTIFNTQN